MNVCIINGVKIEIPNGKNIRMDGNKIFVDGIEIDTKDTDLYGAKTVNVEIYGDVIDVKCNGNVTVKGNVLNGIDCGCSVTVNGNCDGTIDCGGSATIGGNVRGSIDAGGFVNIYHNYDKI